MCIRDRDSDISIAFDEAGNRLTAMRGILVYLMRNEKKSSPLKIAAAKEALADFLDSRILCSCLDDCAEELLGCGCFEA